VLLKERAGDIEHALSIDAGLFGSAREPFTYVHPERSGQFIEVRAVEEGVRELRSGRRRRPVPSGSESLGV
jgi:hypothetical protein